jgi:hypothetical protein
VQPSESDLGAAVTHETNMETEHAACPRWSQQWKLVFEIHLSFLAYCYVGWGGGASTQQHLCVVSIARSQKPNVVEKLMHACWRISCLHLPCLSVRLARLDLLASLLDLLKHSVVVERLCSDDLGRLRLKRNIVRLDTCDTVSVSSATAI